MDDELVVAGGRVHTNQVAQVAENLVDPNLRAFPRRRPQKGQVTPGNLEASGDLPRDSPQTIPHKIEIVALNLFRVARLLIDDLQKAGNDRQRAVDVVNDAGVNL